MKWTDSWTLEKEMGTGTSVTDIELKSAPAKTKMCIRDRLTLVQGDASWTIGVRF